MLRQQIFFFSSLFSVVLCTTITYNQYKYTGLRNTWHNGQYHVHVIVGPFDTEKKVEMACANQCTFDTTCSGFYVGQAYKANISSEYNCHLVRLSLETNKNLTYGYGMMLFDRVFFKKDEMTSEISGELDRELANPCFVDPTIPATPAQCESFYANRSISYYECPASSNNYLGTLSLITDNRCSKETRLLQCQLNGGAADSNINVATRFDILNPGFQRYIYQKEGLVSVAGDELTWLEGTFYNAPKNLTRIILRIADPNTDKIKQGEIVLTPNSGSDVTVPFELPSENTCAVGFVFPGSSLTDAAAAASAAKKFRLNIISKFSQAHGTVGFKIDVYYY